jgi:hypothetical protein
MTMANCGTVRADDHRHACLSTSPTIARAGCAIIAVATASALAAPVSAAQPSGRQDAEEIKAQEDPTILKSRIWAEGEWADEAGDSNTFELTFGARKGWRIADDRDWGLQVEVPYKRVSAAGLLGDDEFGGLADIKLTAGTAWRLSETWRIGGGVELRIPTAEDGLGANIWRLQEFVTVAWDATPWLSFSPKARYFHTLATQQGASQQNYLELYAPATLLMGDGWSMTPRYEAKIDFENDRTTHSAKLSIGKSISPAHLGLALAIKVPLESDVDTFQFFLTATRYF